MVLFGVVEVKGENVLLFNVGDEVFVYGFFLLIKCYFGFYVEYICLFEDWNIVFILLNISFEEVVVIFYGGLFVLYLLKKICINRGDKVLIYGVLGSIGIMVI